jgi:phosphohistidine phosphatase SixA
MDERKSYRRYACVPCLLGIVLSGACARTTTVLLVRHAEREQITATNPNPPLTAAGHARAQVFATVAGSAGVSAIYVSDALRTQQTAAPLATQLNLTPQVFAVGTNPQQHAQSIATDILDNRVGRTVVVVGHSNTVPLIVEALGFAPAPAIPDPEFGHLFVLLKRERGSARLVKGRYGS